MQTVIKSGKNKIRQKGRNGCTVEEKIKHEDCDSSFNSALEQ